MARVLAEQGFNIFLIARDEERLKAAIEDYRKTRNEDKVKMEYIAVDLGKLSTMADYEDMVKMHF